MEREVERNKGREGGQEEGSKAGRMDTPISETWLWPCSQVKKVSEKAKPWSR